MVDDAPVFDALSDGVRRRIVAVVAEHGELTVNSIADEIGTVARSTVSSHLRVLRSANIVQERRDGRSRLYSLDTDGGVQNAVTFLRAVLQLAADSMPDDTGQGLREDEVRADSA